MIFLFAADNSPVIQIGTTESLLGIAVILLGAGAAWGTLKNSVKNIAASVQKIESSVEKMQRSMTTHDVDIRWLKDTKYGVSKSPTVPSEEGKALLEVSGFNGQYPQLKDKLFKLLDEQRPRTLYDYEVGAFDALQSVKDDPLIDPLKDYAVNHPDAPLELIFRIASWVVRDDYAGYRAAKGNVPADKSNDGHA
jgi:hypothetical protein